MRGQTATCLRTRVEIPERESVGGCPHSENQSSTSCHRCGTGAHELAWRARAPLGGGVAVASEVVPDSVTGPKPNGLICRPLGLVNRRSMWRSGSLVQHVVEAHERGD